MVKVDNLEFNGIAYITVDKMYECVGDVPMTDETLRRIELKNNPTLIVKAKESKNNSKNLTWVPHPTNLRREPTKKKKSKKKEPLWKRYREY